jgi:hypothetical protein
MKFDVNPVETIPAFEGEDIEGFGNAAPPGAPAYSGEVMGLGSAPRVVRLRHVVPAEEFLAIRRLAKHFQGPSNEEGEGRHFEMPYTIYGSDKSFRKYADSDSSVEGDLELARNYVKRIDELVLGPGLENAMGGTLRVRRYVQKQGHPEHVDTYQSSLGTLFVTVMLTLRSSMAGGGTIFDMKGPGRHTVYPHTGEVTMWWSCKADGKADKSSMHVGEPVRKGVKWTATYFIYHKDRHVCNNTFWQDIWSDRNRSWQPLADFGEFGARAKANEL